MRRQFLIAAIIGAMFAQTSFAASSQWSIGFLEGADSAANQARINWNAFTHIADFGVGPLPDGTLQCDFNRHTCTSSAFTAPRATLISTAHSHGAKVLMTISDGALSQGSQPYFLSATASGTLNTFISNIMALVNANGYDGVDIDWENNIESSADHAQMVTFLNALRAALGSKLLTVDAIPDDYVFWSTHYSNLDRVNFMDYDWEGYSWNPYAWFNSAEFSDACDCVWSLDLIKRRALGAGIPAGKMTFGIPFYGYVSTGGGVTAPRQKVSGSSYSQVQTTYASLLSSYSSQMANPTVDSVAKVPWFAISNGWVEYDNAASITAKLQYMQSNSLGGWHIFSINKDASGQPLAAAVAAVMGGSTPPPSSCDINGDGATNVSDVQACVNQALGSATCSSCNLTQASPAACNAVDVQRDVNAALGGQCITGP